MNKADVLARLRATSTADLSSKAQTVCASLIKKLQSPVRLGLFGLPDAGKRHILNVLFGETIADPGLLLPTFELTHGAIAETEAVLPDGGAVNARGYPSREIADLMPVFLKVQTPTRQMPDCDVLLVAADPTPSDLTAALAWASARVDVSIWCSRQWTDFEHQIWSAAPETLHNHAILVLTGHHDDAGARAKRAVNLQLFQTVLSLDLSQNSRVVPSVNNDKSATALLSHLTSTIHEATTQDMLAAELFLHRYEPRREVLAVPEAEAPPEVPEATPPSNVVAHPAMEAQGPDQAKQDKADKAEAHVALARVFQFVRQSADDLRRSLPTGPNAQMDVDQTLSEIEAIFETLADRVCDQDVLESAWPQLCGDILEARDLALLMRIEGGADQLEDLAMLLLQLRQEIEVKLAA
ncbi:hypothetical protein [Primorskyibacter sp. 2E233]|uniref:hypothetical protein n=1 Tax=Primorskyibacter sp. 2E233 TaxID=3413431 RepID=UPI003BF0A28C